MRRAVGILLVAAALCGASIAEVSVRLSGPTGGGVIILGIIDHADPLGIAWEPVRDIPPDLILNAGGATRGDGWPSIAKDPGSGFESVVWAYNAGSDFDIAYSEWDGTQWSTTEFLTASTANELDPAVWVQADGTAHVVWWEEGTTDKVLLSTRPPGGTVWSPPVQVSQGPRSARRPSVTCNEGTVVVVYEQDTTAGQDIVVATNVGGSFSPAIVHSTTRTEPLDAMIHSRGTVMWLDWKDDPDVLGRATWNSGAWSINTPEPCLDNTWVGIENTRRTIKGRVLQIQ